VALETMVDRLAEDHANARHLAERLAEIPGIEIEPAAVETNIVIFDISGSRMSGPELTELMKEEGVLIHAFGKTQIRLVTHLDVNKEDIEIALKAFAKVFSM